MKKREKTHWGDLNPAYLNVGIYLATPILLGSFIGYQLDIRFHSKPTYFMIFLILGTASSFYNLWKLTKF